MQILFLSKSGNQIHVPIVGKFFMAVMHLACFPHNKLVSLVI
jgi:hypothetical protein